MLDILGAVNTNPMTFGRITVYLFMFLVVTMVCALVQYQWKKRQIYKVVSHLPQVPTIPFLGSAHMFLGLESEGLYKKILELFNGHMKYLTEGPLKFWFGPKLLILSGKPEDLQIILTSPNALEKCPEFYKCLRETLGISPLLYKPVAQWKPHRKLLQTVLTKVKCFDYVEDFNNLSDIFLSDLDDIRKVGVTHHNLETIIDVLFIRCVCGCLMGSEVLDLKRISTYAEGSRGVIDMSFQRMLKMWLHNEFIYKHSKQHKLHSYFYDLTVEFRVWYIQNRIEIQAKMQRDMAMNKDVKFEKCLLDLILELHDAGELTEKGAKDECGLFFGAAMDTSAFSTHVFLLMIAMYPEVQEKVYEEIYGIFGDSDRPVDADDVRQMKYLEMVLKESLRLYTPVPVIARKVTKDLKLESCTIPAGTTVIPSPYAVHHNPKVYPDPEKFDPERFHPDIKRHPYSFIPFSAGPRNCIGYSFGFVLMKVLLAKIVRKYKLSTECKHSDIKVKLTLTAKIADSKPLYFEERIKK